MKRIFAIAALTWKAAFRYRLFWVLAALLATAVIAFPLMLKDDGTARGLTQILLTYSLSSITGLLGFATLWLSCGTLARDVEECQMQVVSTKPIARWQIWIGKWAGIMSLNAVLIALSGAAVFYLVQHRANSLPASEQAILKREVFVARGSVKPPVPDITAEFDRLWKERTNAIHAQLNPANEKVLRAQVTQYIWARKQNVLPGYAKRFTIELGHAATQSKGQPLQVRVKLRSSDPNAPEGRIYHCGWRVGDPESGKALEAQQDLPADSFQEFSIPPDLYDANGKLTIVFLNASDFSLRFDIDDGLEVLYPEGTFGLNFARGLGIIFCWVALLAAIGLAASSWLSFPVAAFFSITVLIVGLSSGLLSNAIEQGTVFGLDHETQKPSMPAVDGLILPAFKGALAVIELVKNFSPVDSLSSGRSITWGELGRAVVQVVFFMGGIFATIGIVLFTRRELAAVQSSS